MLDQRDQCVRLHKGKTTQHYISQDTSNLPSLGTEGIMATSESADEGEVTGCCTKHAHVSRTEYSTPKFIDVA
jgi:hypothetical protein